MGSREREGWGDGEVFDESGERRLRRLRTRNETMAEIAIGIAIAMKT